MLHDPHGAGKNILPARARSAIGNAPEAWNQWLNICAALDDPDVEMTGEEFAVFYEHFSRLRRVGVPFDPAFVLAVEELRRGLLDAHEDFVEDATPELDADECPAGTASFFT
jgi:hypothetical protein